MSEQSGGGMRQELQQRQGLVLTPALTQALHILTMPVLELAEYLRTQVEENPALELGGEDSDAREQALAEDNVNKASNTGSGDEDNINWDDWQRQTLLPRDYDPNYTGNTYNAEPGIFSPEHGSDNEQDLYAALRLQLTMLPAQPPLKQVALYIIEHLDEDGYLALPLPRLVQLCGYAEELLDEALVLVQSLEPAGVGARDLRECLRLQISATEPQRALLLAIIDKHLPDVAKNRVQETARALKTTAEQVERAFGRIRALHPRPAAGLGSTAATPYIVPDIFIRKIGGSYQVFLNEALEPQLHISAYYRRLAPQLWQDKEAQDYLRHKFSAAQTLLNNMEKRRQTLTRLAEITAQRQYGFLEQGLAQLAPLTMKEVAEQADMHESTVSRAVAGKYVQTPRGMYEWKFFFPRAYATQGGIITPAWVKQQLSELIAGEDKTNPYSDQSLQELLAQQDLHLARRTVAKYREELRIPPRFLRRQTRRSTLQE